MPRRVMGRGMEMAASRVKVVVVVAVVEVAVVEVAVVAVAVVEVAVVEVAVVVVAFLWGGFGVVALRRQLSAEAPDSGKAGLKGKKRTKINKISPTSSQPK